VAGKQGERPLGGGNGKARYQDYGKGLLPFQRGECSKEGGDAGETKGDPGSWYLVYYSQKETSYQGVAGNRGAISKGGKNKNPGGFRSRGRGKNLEGRSGKCWPSLKLEKATPRGTLQKHKTSL